MTERKPPGMGFETWIDKQIREATERGEFDNLPGAGKPIPGQGQPDDELWWVRGYVRREGLPGDVLLPTPLRLRNEIERLPRTVRELRTEPEVRAVVGQLNRRIVAWMRVPTGPRVPISPVDADRVVEQWRAARTSGTAPGPRTHPDQPRRRAPWWRRLVRPAGR